MAKLFSASDINLKVSESYIGQELMAIIIDVICFCLRAASCLSCGRYNGKILYAPKQRRRRRKAFKPTDVTIDADLHFVSAHKVYCFSGVASAKTLPPYKQWVSKPILGLAFPIVYC